MSGIAKAFSILETVVAIRSGASPIPRWSPDRSTKSQRPPRPEVPRPDGIPPVRRRGGALLRQPQLASLGSAWTSHFDLKGYVRPHCSPPGGNRAYLQSGVLSEDAGSIWTRSNPPRRSGSSCIPLSGSASPSTARDGKGPAGRDAAGERRKILGRRLEAFTPHTITNLRRWPASCGKWSNAGMRWIGRRSRGASCVWRHRSEVRTGRQSRPSAPPSPRISTRSTGSRAKSKP